ncbi:MAG: hypothetical protein K2F99_00320, partial [Muribaculaceae bacterium]|nr:hypothetical protein [Muribaculaceae bacterium]
MTDVKYINLLTEAGIEVNRAFFMCLDEANQVAISDDVLTGMMKFITDKYNSIDFGEIERSAGDITRFKYLGMIRQNTETLKKIYGNSPDTGAKKYVDVAVAVESVLNHLELRRNDYSTLYKSGNGLIQLIYTSCVAACLFSIGILISNTIRFVTTETETDCQVLYDEIPGTAKNVHIKNVLSAASSIKDFERLLDTYKRKPTNEAFALEPILAGALAVGAVIYLIPKILVLIREIIYSIYFLRIKVSDMLTLQIDLINTNIESLERRGGDQKDIAKQARVAKKLESRK